MIFEDQPITFRCNADALFGILSMPRQPSRRGVLIVVGGPQYRVGSHRQFVLIARKLAAQGYACLRFDVRGMGDSGGAARTFEDIGDDIGAATDAFLAAVPAMREVVIWGLCDAASAALFYAAGDQRISGLVLLNPWARTAGGLANATLKHYYLDRLRQPALWKKIAEGQFEFGKAVRSFAHIARAALGAGTAAAPTSATSALPLPQRMMAGLARFEGNVLLITCDIDLTAQEFISSTRQSPEWKRLLAAPRVTHRTMPDADHTFSRRAWRDDVVRWTGDWIGSW